MDAEFNILLKFFKVMANENRLKILGILANRICSVEELATLLNLKDPTVSHHLSKLRDLGLVNMRTDGNDHLYWLNLDVLHSLNKTILSSLTLEKIATLVDDNIHDVWEQKILNNFIAGDQIKEIPAGYKKRLVVLKWLVGQFKMGVKYPEQEVNEIIKRHHPDYCRLRRELVDHGFMEREEGIYWRIDWQMPDFAS